MALSVVWLNMKEYRITMETNNSYRYFRLFEGSTYLQYYDMCRKDDKFAFQLAWNFILHFLTSLNLISL